eukprot:SAG22_NODE_580_length_8907_cov_5.217416_2_plen_325_part_00
MQAREQAAKSRLATMSQAERQARAAAASSPYRSQYKRSPLDAYVDEQRLRTMLKATALPPNPQPGQLVDAIRRQVPVWVWHGRDRALPGYRVLAFAKLLLPQESVHPGLESVSPTTPQEATTRPSNYIQCHTCNPNARVGPVPLLLTRVLGSLRACRVVLVAVSRCPQVVPLNLDSEMVAAIGCTVLLCATPPVSVTRPRHRRCWAPGAQPVFISPFSRAFDLMWWAAFSTTAVNCSVGVDVVPTDRHGQERELWTAEEAIEPTTGFGLAHMAAAHDNINASAWLRRHGQMYSGAAVAPVDLTRPVVCKDYYGALPSDYGPQQL